MRIAGYIEHPPYHITLFEMNHRFSIKIEWQGLEQWYKVRPGAQIHSVNAIKEGLTEQFWKGVPEVFEKMKNLENQMFERQDMDSTDLPEII